MIWSNVLIAWTLCGPLFLILMAFEVQDAPIPTRMMAIANGTCVSFCNQPKANIFGYLTRITPASAGIWLRQESLRHILASPGYASGTITVNVTWIERGFNACQMPRSMYRSIFNRFPVIQPVSSKVRHFSTYFGLPWVRRWDNRGKCKMDGKRIQCL